MPGVSDMIGKLDAAAVQAKKEAAERRARGTNAFYEFLLSLLHNKISQ